MIKPKKVYLFEHPDESWETLFAIEFFGAKENETFLLLCQPPYGQFDDLSQAHEDWFRWGCEVRQIPMEQYAFPVDFTYLDEENLG